MIPDQVDRLVAAWRRERPDLDVSPLEVLSRVVRLARHLDMARRDALGEMGLPQWQFDVLTALRRAGAGNALTPGELLRETLVSSGTMTHRLDQLEAGGLVSRAADLADGRAVRVTLTAAGREAVDAALSALLARERRLLGSLSRGDSDTLARLLRSLLEPFDGEGATAGTGSPPD